MGVVVTTTKGEVCIFEALSHRGAQVKKIRFFLFIYFIFFYFILFYFIYVLLFFVFINSFFSLSYLD